MALYERRIGQRKPFEGFPAALVPVKRHPSGTGVRRPRRASETHGHVLDMSLSGANLEVPTKLDLRIGGLVEVRLGDDRTFVGRVKRMRPTDDEAWVRCGVVYRDMSAAYRSWLGEWTAPQPE